MADVQQQFEQFHAAIRMDYGMAKELRDRRDTVLTKIWEYLTANQLPSFREIGQGSYTMKTGTKPIADLEYDLDVALRFDFHADEHTADEVRGWIYEALQGHTRSIEKKKPCVRVAYEAGYHIDVTSYAVWEDDARGEQFRLARSDSGWTPEDPVALLAYVDDYRKEQFEDTDDSATKTDQFRRAVRSLRRAMDVEEPRDSSSKPVGMAFVLAAIQRELKPAKSLDGERCDDRKCLERFSRSLSETDGRIVATKPTGGKEDLFARLRNEEMEEFKVWLGTVADALEFAGRTTDPVKACHRLQEVFGDDFPVPDAKDTATTSKAPAIVTSSTSA